MSPSEIASRRAAAARGRSSTWKMCRRRRLITGSSSENGLILVRSVSYRGCPRTAPRDVCREDAAVGEAEEAVLALIGDRVALGPLRADLVPLYHRWEQQLAVLAGLGQVTLETLEARQASYDAAAQAGADSAYFTVYARDTADRWQPIGTTTLHIDQRKQIADYVIVLGERRGEGLGTAATRLTLDWAFNVAGLVNVRLEVWAPNKAAIGAYERAGFKHIGIRRNGARWLGQQCDEVIMDAVPEDLTESVVEGQV